MFRELGEGEACLLPFVQIHEFEALEITYQDVPRPVALRNGIEISHGLIPRGDQISSSAFLLYEQHSRPEQVDETMLVVQLAYMLLVAGNAASLNAEDVEEIVVETLRFALFVGGVLPFLGECCGPRTYFVPRKPH